MAGKFKLLQIAMPKVLFDALASMAAGVNKDTDDFAEALLREIVVDDRAAEGLPPLDLPDEN